MGISLAKNITRIFQIESNNNSSEKESLFLIQTSQTKEILLIKTKQYQLMTRHKKKGRQNKEKSEHYTQRNTSFIEIELLRGHFKGNELEVKPEQRVK